MQSSLTSVGVKITTFFSLIFILCLTSFQQVLAKEASLVLQEAFGSDPYQFVTHHNDLIVASSKHGRFTDVGGTSLDVFTYTGEGFELIDQHFLTQLSPIGQVTSIDAMFETNGFITFVIFAGRTNSVRYLVTATMTETELTIIDTEAVSDFDVRAISSNGANNNVYIISPYSPLSLITYNITDDGEIITLEANDISDLFERDSIFGVEQLHASFDNDAIFIVSAEDDGTAVFYQIDMDIDGTLTQTTELTITDPGNQYFNLVAKDGLIYLSNQLGRLEIAELDDTVLTRLVLPEVLPEVKAFLSYNNYAIVVGAFSYVSVLDLTDTDNLRVVDQALSGDLSTDATIVDNTIFISESSSGISALSIDDMGTLTFEDRFSQSSTATDFSLLDDTFAHVGGGNAIHLWNINDDQTSQLTTRFSQTNGISAVSLRENDLLLTNGSRIERHLLEDVLLQIDNGEFIGAVDVSGAEGRIIALENGYVVEAYQYIKFYSLALEEVDSYELPRESLNAYYKQFSYAADNKLYVPTNDPKRVSIFDTSNINNVSLISQNLLDSDYTMKNNLASKGDALYVPSLSDRRVEIQVVDISDPNDFTVVTTLDIEDRTSRGFFIDAATVHVYDNYLVVLADEGYLYNIDDPLNPELIDTNDQVSSNGYAQNFENAVYSVKNHTSGRILRSYINFAPQLQAIQMQFQEDTISDANTIMLPEQDQEGDLLEYEVLNNNDFVTASLNDTNTLTVIGKANQFGETTLSVQATDVHGNIGAVSININILAVNDAPDIDLTRVTLDEDTLIVINLNATDVEDNSFTISISEAALFGTAEITENGELSYQPNANFFGDDSVEIVLTDELGAQTTRQVPITVVSVNDLPILVGELTVQSSEDEVFTITFDSNDVENDPITFSISSLPDDWTIDIVDTTATITPAENDEGTFEIGFSLSDGINTNIQTYSIMLEAQNDAPTVAETTLSTRVVQGDVVNGNINATDVDDDSLTYEVSTAASKGSVSVDEQGNYTFTANQTETGADSFIITVSDAAGDSVAVTVSVNISPLPNSSIPETGSSSSGGAISGTTLVILLMLVAIRRRTSVTTHHLTQSAA